MTAKITDGAAALTAVSAPVWGLGLDEVNRWLTFFSVIAGLVFLWWRWRRLARLAPDLKED